MSEETCGTLSIAPSFMKNELSMKALHYSQLKVNYSSRVLVLVFNHSNS